VQDPALRMLAPAELAELVDPERYLDPLPLSRDPALERLLWFAGVGDLLARADVLEVVEGPAREDLSERAEALHAELTRTLGAAQAGRRVRAVEHVDARCAL